MPTLLPISDFPEVSSTKNKIVNDSIVVEVANPEIKKYIEEKAADFLSHKQKSFLIENIRKLISTTVEIAAGALGPWRGWLPILTGLI